MSKPITLWPGTPLLHDPTVPPVREGDVVVFRGFDDVEPVEMKVLKVTPKHETGEWTITYMKLSEAPPL